MIEQANETAENVQLKIALEKQTRTLRDAIKNCNLALNVLESGFTR